MSAFIRCYGTIKRIICSYLVEKNSSQLPTRVETLSQRNKKI